MEKMLENSNQIESFSLKYRVPKEDIILIALNCMGVNADLPDKRIRFKLKLNTTKEIFYMAICVNTGKSPFFIKGNDLFLNEEQIGTVIERENDTCDSTYFRRGKTVLTLNSNSRSQCIGCKFCGTYNQNAQDVNDLLTEDKLEARMRQVLAENKMKDMSKMKEVGICTGCFASEDEAVSHILMVRKVLRKFGFEKEINYLGSQITSRKAIDVLAEKAGPVGIFLTLECFTRRNELLKSPKAAITAPKAMEILAYAKAKGVKATILCILGLDPSDIFIKELGQLATFVNRFPIINIFQNYAPEHESLRIAEAKDLGYYLQTRQKVEEIFAASSLKPRPWENYRGLWHLSFNNQPLNDIRI